MRKIYFSKNLYFPSHSLRVLFVFLSVFSCSDSLLGTSDVERVAQFAETRQLYHQGQIITRTGTGLEATIDIKNIPPVAPASPISWQTNPRAVPRNPHHPGQDGQSPLPIEFSDMDTGTIAEILDYFKTNESLSPNMRIRLVNFANAFGIGGGVTLGSKAQEEDLMRAIAGLYESLIPYARAGSIDQDSAGKFNRLWYDLQNQLTDDLATGAYLTQNATLIRDRNGNLRPPILVDIISSAAYNLGTGRRGENYGLRLGGTWQSGKSATTYSVDPEAVTQRVKHYDRDRATRQAGQVEILDQVTGQPLDLMGQPLTPLEVDQRKEAARQAYREGTQKRIRTQLHAAATEGIRPEDPKPFLVLGTFGSGAFSNDLEQIADLYARELDAFAFKNAFTGVVFSLYGKSPAEKETFIKYFWKKQIELKTKNVSFTFPQFTPNTSWGLFQTPAGISSNSLITTAQVAHPSHTQSGLRLDPSSTANIFKPSAGSLIRFQNGTERRVVEVQGDDIFFEGPPVAPQPFSVLALPEDKVAKNPIDWTDSGWFHGYSRGLPRFFVPNTNVNRQTYTNLAKTGTPFAFSPKIQRKITNTEESGPFLHVLFEGDPLSEAEVNTLMTSSAGSSLPLLQADGTVEHPAGMQTGLRLPAAGGSNTVLPVSGSFIRLNTGEKRRVVEVRGNDVFFEGPALPPQTAFSLEPDSNTLDLKPVNWTDGGWSHGYSRTQPKFFIPETEKNRATYRAAIGKVFTFANGISRKITAVDDASPFLYISFEGEPLSEEEIGRMVDAHLHLPQATLPLPAASGSQAIFPTPGSSIRLANGEIRRVVAVSGDSIFLEGLPVAPQNFALLSEPQEPDLQPVDWTDGHWKHGILSGGNKFFIPATEENKELYRNMFMNQQITFANGESRRITGVEDAGPFLHIVFDGAPIDGNAANGPFSIG